MLNQLVDAVGQPLFLVILSRSIYLYLSADFRRSKRLQRQLPPGVARTARLWMYVLYFPPHCAFVLICLPIIINPQP